MGNGKVYLSRESFEKMKKELEALRGEKIPEISAAIGHAIELGDISESGEYETAQRAMQDAQKRVLQLEEKLLTAVLYDEEDIASDRVYIGAYVQVRDLKDNSEPTYRIVGVDEVDIENNRISHSSPLGQAFMGKAVGNVVEARIPRGVLRFEILKIHR